VGARLVPATNRAFGGRPWDGEHSCGCGAAGMPCPNCNPSDKDHPPRPPKGFQRDDSLDND
jgi:hypothetical protein